MLLKRLLFRLLGRRLYLRLVSSFYFVSYDKGWLRNSPDYKWHYFVTGLIKPGDVVIDIGANLGYFARVFLSSIGSTGQLWCVEPLRVHRDILETQLEGHPNAHVLPYALGSEPGTLPMGTPLDAPFRHGLTRGISPEGQPDMEIIETAEVRTPNDVFSDLDRIDYIKCDVEGAELTVLEAMRSLLAKYKPKVQVEISAENRKPLWDLFHDLGYQPYALHQGRLERVNSLDAQVKGDWLWR